MRISQIWDWKWLKNNLIVLLFLRVIYAWQRQESTWKLFIYSRISLIFSWFSEERNLQHKNWLLAMKLLKVKNVFMNFIWIFSLFILSFLSSTKPSQAVKRFYRLCCYTRVLMYARRLVKSMRERAREREKVSKNQQKKSCVCIWMWVQRTLHVVWNRKQQLLVDHWSARCTYENFLSCIFKKVRAWLEMEISFLGSSCFFLFQTNSDNRAHIMLQNVDFHLLQGMGKY